MTIGFNEIIWLVIGTIVGLIAGIAIYWLPLGQFMNEIKALWNLKKTYKTGDEILVRSSTDLFPIDLKLSKGIVTTNTKMKIWHDEGVGWHHTHAGWKRVRILHVFDPNQKDLPDVYKICHLDILG